jgi:predicted HicB family RNase H-like nuclease
MNDIKKSRTKEINDYKRKMYKRISLEIKKDDYEILKKAATGSGITVNTFIKQAIQDKLNQD